MAEAIPSRGKAISGYFPNMGPSGYKVYRSNLRGTTFTSTLANSGVVYGFTHGLGEVPAFVFFTNRGTVGVLKGAATSAQSIGLATVSAMTSSKFYVAGSKNTGFTAFLLV